MTVDIYVSADIEADGPIPGPYSMLAVGLAVAGRYDGETFARVDPSSATFYRELKPISDQTDSEALRIAGLDRDRLMREGLEPAEAMRAAAAWVGEQAVTARPVLVGYPVVFDWMFLHWYFVRFLGESPFGFSGALDMKTMYQQKARVALEAAGRDELPTSLRSTREHTHTTPSTTRSSRRRSSAGCSSGKGGRASEAERQGPWQLRLQQARPARRGAERAPGPGRSPARPLGGGAS